MLSDDGVHDCMMVMMVCMMILFIIILFKTNDELYPILFKSRNSDDEDNDH
jgi:hypothetical protein